MYVTDVNIQYVRDFSLCLANGCQGPWGVSPIVRRGVTWFGGKGEGSPDSGKGNRQIVTSRQTRGHPLAPDSCMWDREMKFTFKSCNE